MELIRLILMDDSISPEQKSSQLQELRDNAGENRCHIDMLLLHEFGRLRTGLRRAKEVQNELEGVFGELEGAYKRLTQPPLYPATFLEYQMIAGEETALVNYESTLRFVRVIDELDKESVAAGDQVLLSGDLNLLVCKISATTLSCGETATFERFTPDGRLVLSRRDEEIIAKPSERILHDELEKGDEVRWNPAGRIAYEKIPKATGDHLFFEEAPKESFDDIGGLDTQIEELKHLILLHLENPALTGEYGLPLQRAIMLEGPPGTGKTLLVKALVNWLRELSKSGRSRFMNIKPGELGSMWYSQTEAKIREVFKVAREAAAADPDIPVVMFFDEFDSIASARGANLHRVDDRAVDALAVELDGLEDRGNILVIAATNRQDILDEAITRPGRFGDNPIRIGRPNRAGARSILSKYFRADKPYASSADGDGLSARDEIVDSTLSRLYAPNGESDVATITFRDGTRRTVRIHELVSGAVLAKLAHKAARAACLREIETGTRGIRPDDVFDAISEEIENAARLLTPVNCKRYLIDLPQDLDVVSVEPVRKKVVHTHRFVQVA